MNKRKLFILVLVIFCTKSFSQEIPKDTTKNLDITAFPIVFYTPETDFGFGGLGVATFWLKNELHTSRPSSVQLGISYTTKKQFLGYFPFELYANDEKWRLVGELGFYKYVYNYFGQGIDSSKEAVETFDVSFPRVRLSLLREVYANFSVGLSYELDDFKNLKSQANGILETSDAIGKTGGAVSNIGILAFYDTRDNIFYPTKGFFLQASYYVSSELLGSSFQYSKYQLDNRYYQKVGEKQVLATNLFFGSGTDGMPFLDQFFIGGKRTRGFSPRRYQDNAELSFVVEYRFPIVGRFGGVAFGATATVAPTLEEVFSSPYKNAGGVGLRYIINKRDGVRIRADYGYSKEGGNFSFTIKEAF
tara:strand:+ start:117094 stop:118176 length:1083 start_codon:yes stop_codon:yes gene_type:complete